MGICFTYINLHFTHQFLWSRVWKFLDWLVDWLFQVLRSFPHTLKTHRPSTNLESILRIIFKILPTIVECLDLNLWLPRSMNILDLVLTLYLCFLVKMLFDFLTHSIFVEIESITLIQLFLAPWPTIARLITLNQIISPILLARVRWFRQNRRTTSHHRHDSKRSWI